MLNGGPPTLRMTSAKIAISNFDFLCQEFGFAPKVLLILTGLQPGDGDESLKKTVSTVSAIPLSFSRNH
jgi:hypothetical protein